MTQGRRSRRVEILEVMPNSQGTSGTRRGPSKRPVLPLKDSAAFKGYVRSLLADADMKQREASIAIGCNERWLAHTLSSSASVPTDRACKIAEWILSDERFKTIDRRPLTNMLSQIYFEQKRPQRLFDTLPFLMPRSATKNFAAAFNRYLVSAGAAPLAPRLIEDFFDRDSSHSPRPRDHSSEESRKASNLSYREACGLDLVTTLTYPYEYQKGKAGQRLKKIAPSRDFPHEQLFDFKTVVAYVANEVLDRTRPATQKEVREYKKRRALPIDRVDASVAKATLITARRPVDSE